MSHRVLLVDDVADLRYLLRLVLETDGGFEVVGEAGNGEAAVELAAATKPDAVILDLSMPTMDGLEALPRLRELLPTALIVVLSGFEGARVASSAEKLGADAYFEKGTSPTLVVAHLKDVLGAEDPPGPKTGVTSLDGEELRAIIAHDLAGPLSTIVGFGSTLDARWDLIADDVRRQLVARMTAQARDLHVIAENLLVARASNRRLTALDVKPVAPAALLTAAAELLSPLCGEHPLHVDVAPDLPVVLADRIAFGRIMSNLVVNARQHAPTGTPIRISAEPDGACVAIAVIDQGPGIPYEDRVRVLEQHVRLARDAKGLGLGLFIASSLATAMGGSLAIADRDGGGARVVCRLRCADPSG